MPKSVESVADEIVQTMRRSNYNVLTVRWPEFYELCDRDRLRKGFLESLSARLAESSILLAHGNSTVVLVRDYDFSPYKNAVVGTSS